MPSKGVDYYSYISVPNATVAFSGPKVGSTTTAANNFQKNHLEIDSANIPGIFNYTGRYEWNVTVNGSTIADQYNDITIARDQRRKSMEGERILDSPQLTERRPLV